MSAVDSLREFVNERLTAAAEEIFGVFKRMIVEYEEEIDRQRKLLHIVWKPEGQVNRTELPEEPVCKEEEEEEEALRDQERNQEPVEIKEEEEELCSGQEGELLVLKLEADEESGPEPQADHQRLHQVAESRQHHDPDSGSTTDSEPEQRRHHNPLTGQTFFRCDVCGKDFKYQTTLQVHLRKHAGDEPNVCKLCGKDFQFGSRLKVHMRSHTGEKPYCCKSCGKTFGYRAGLIKHARVHTGEEES